MTSGSYFPGPVRAVEIPKKGGTRILGIPNVVDRVAQSVAVAVLEPNVEKVFHDDSYGYRPGRSPLDAVKVCRERCWKRDWIVDLDVKAFFDSVPWDLMLKALERHTDQKWVRLYVARWLKAPMLMPDGTMVARVKGTPQGGPRTPPTQLATSVSRCRCATAEWSDRGVSQGARDMSRSTLVTCAVVVAPRAGRALVARSAPSGSTPPLIWCRRGFRLPRPRGGSPSGSSAHSGRRTGTWNAPVATDMLRCRPRPRCSPSSCRCRWPRGSAGTPPRRGGRCPRSSGRRWRSSWRGPTETIRGGDGTGGRHRVRLRPPAGRGIVGGLPHPCPRTTGPQRAVRSGSELCR